MTNSQNTADINGKDNANDKSIESRLRFSPAIRAVRIGMLNNPLSGGNRKGLQKIQEAAATARPEVLQREVQTPADVSEALADFARREVNIVVVNGGDGTVQAALTAIFHHRFFETKPALAVLPSAGTTSMIAGDVGLKGSRLSSLQKLFSRARTNNDSATIIQRPVLKVQVPSLKAPIYGMFFGAATIYQATHFCLQKVHTRGVRGEIGAGVAMVRFLWAAILKDRKVVPPVPITIGLNQNEPQKQKYLLVLITTLQRLFLGLRPFWGSQPKPLHYTAVDAHPRNFLQALPSAMRGHQSRHITPTNGYVSHNIDEARLTLDSGFNLDGELYNPGTTLGPVVVGYGGQASFLQL
jgi:diacylglycerol kinase family enzyme